MKRESPRGDEPRGPFQQLQRGPHNYVRRDQCSYYTALPAKCQQR